MDSSFIEKIASLAQTAHGGVPHALNGIPYLAMPKDSVLVSAERTLTAPVRVRASVKLDTIGSLVDYVQRHQTGNLNNAPAVIFADRKQLRFTAFLDYHQPDKPAWMDHTAAVTLELSQQLKTWMEKAGKPMNQVQFAEFLDDNLADIQTPNPSEVLDFVEKLECTRTETFKSAIKQTTGEVAFTFTKENAGIETAKILETFTLGIPVWHRGAPVVIKAKLYHRIQDATLTFRYKLEQLDRIQDVLWDETLSADLLQKLNGVALVYEGAAPAAPAPLT